MTEEQETQDNNGEELQAVPSPNWLGAAWDDYIDHLPVLLAVSLFLAALSAPSFYILRRWHSYIPALAYMLFIMSPFSVGVNLVYIKLARGETKVFSALFSAFPVYHKAIAVTVWLGLITAGGTLLFIIPGAVIYTTYFFSEYVVVDRSTGVRESFALSAALTEGWRIPLAMVLMMLVLMEVLIPSPVYITGGFSDPVVKTDLAAWGIAAFTLKTLVFLPWLHLGLARAYNMLIGRPGTTAKT